MKGSECKFVKYMEGSDKELYLMKIGRKDPCPCGSEKNIKIVASERKKCPRNKTFYGNRDTYSGKAHCIKDRVLLDDTCGRGSFQAGTN